MYTVSCSFYVNVITKNTKGFSSMMLKKLPLILVLVLACNTVQAGITLGKIAELPMKVCLGAAMLYTGSKAWEHGNVVAAILNQRNRLRQELQKNPGATRTVQELWQELETVNVMVPESLKQKNSPEDVVLRYTGKTVMTLFMTLGIGYYFFFN